MRPPAASPGKVLTLNGDSSSIKFAVYVLGAAGSEPQRGLSGQLNRIGQPGERLTVRAAANLWQRPTSGWWAG